MVNIAISTAKVLISNKSLFQHTWQYSSLCYLQQATLIRISVQSMCCIVNSPNTTQHKITKHNPRRKLSPQIKMLLTAKTFERPGPALQRVCFFFFQGALNPTAFLRWIQWNGLTHSRFTRSASALLALTIDKATKQSKAWKNKIHHGRWCTSLQPPKIHVSPLGTKCCCLKIAQKSSYWVEMDAWNSCNRKIQVRTCSFRAERAENLLYIISL